MICITDFQANFNGKQFKSGTGSVYVAVGYGDNGSNGNPYIVGASSDGATKTTKLKTFLFRDVEFLPVANPATAT